MVEIFFKKHNGKLITDLTIKDIPDILKGKEGLLWVDIEINPDEKIEPLLETFGIHPLTIEDCTVPNVRPKLEQFEEYLFLVLHAVSYEQKEKKVRLSELDLCLGKNFLISVHGGAIPSVDLAKQRTRENLSNFNKGADFLLYSIIDALVDNYFPILGQLDRNFDQLEDEMSAEPTPKTLDHLYDLKKDVGYLRRTLGPQRDIVNLLARGHYALIKQTHYHHFRDIYDHLVRLSDLVDISRDAVADILDVYASVSFNRFNEITKVLTIIATIMMPLTLITGIYGMNFKYMPEIAHRYGYLFFWVLMLLVTLGMLTFFKRRKWL